MVELPIRVLGAIEYNEGRLYCTTCDEDVDPDPDGSPDVYVHTRELCDDAYMLDSDHVPTPRRESSGWYVHVDKGGYIGADPAEFMDGHPTPGAAVDALHKWATDRTLTFDDFIIHIRQET